MAEVPPEALAMNMGQGNWKAQALRSFIISGMADALDKLSDKNSKFVDAAAIAKEAGLDAKSTFRLLRYLSILEVCVEDEAGAAFKLGPIGGAVVKSNPKNVADAIVLETSMVHAKFWEHLPDFLKTGKPTINAAFGVDSYFAMCEQNPAHLEVFQKAMSGYSNDEGFMMATAAPTFDLSGYKSVCDLGGAEGTLAKTLSTRFPDIEWVLADLPECIERIDASSFPANFKLESCNFLEKVPVVDAYLLKHIIHDWDDEKSKNILENIKKTNPKAKVFIMEFGPMPGPNVPHMAKGFDIHMGVALGGHERTQEEYDALYAASGFERVATHLLAGGDYPLYVQEIEASI